MSNNFKEQLQENSLKSGYWSPFRGLIKRNERGLVSQKHIVVCWDLCKRGRCNVTVIPFDRKFLEDKRVRATWLEYVTFTCMEGCCSKDWASDDNAATGLFCALLADDGFADEFEFYRALFEFAQIEECQWARDMLNSSTAGIRPRLIEYFENDSFIESLQYDYLCWWLHEWGEYPIDEILADMI